MHFNFVSTFLDELVGFINRENFIEDAIFGKNFISTEIPVELIAEIRDPTGYFTGRCGIPPANITYKWIINDEVQEETSKAFSKCLIFCLDRIRVRIFVPLFLS